MKNWRKLKLGDRLIETVEEFGITTKVLCEVTKIENDHAIATEVNDFDYKMNLWIDDGTQDMFEREV